MLLKSAYTWVLLIVAVNAVPSPHKDGKQGEHVRGAVNKGLVAIGIVPATARDDTGITIGGLGSAIAFKLGTFRKHHDGHYTGTLVSQPDRGWNVISTVNYQARQHDFKFRLTPYYGHANLSYENAKKTFILDYKRTLLYTDRSDKPTTGLNPEGVRPATKHDPPLPIPSPNDSRLTIDAEGLVLNHDGSFWTSDEYGAYIYKFSPQGKLRKVIQPPKSVLPYDDGKLNFTGDANPQTGRAGNQGFEALTASPDGKRLYAMLQTATMQDGGANFTTDRYTRLFEWDVDCTSPKLVGEWVVPLPLASNGNVYPQSDIHYLDGKRFLVLARDGSGNGATQSLSGYKSVDIFDIEHATDIHKSKYNWLTPMAPKGVLSPKVVPATYKHFLSLVDNKQLNRFGLHNGGPFDETLIDAKWESTALAPVLDPHHPDDYFLFVASDNDFITVDGMMPGEPYSDPYGSNVNSQFLVYRVTLPSVPRGSVARAIGIHN